MTFQKSWEGITGFFIDFWATAYLPFLLLLSRVQGPSVSLSSRGCWKEIADRRSDPGSAKGYARESEYLDEKKKSSSKKKKREKKMSAGGQAADCVFV